METINKINIKQFVEYYLITAAWVTCDSDECATFTNEAREIAKADCEKFINDVIAEMGEDKANELLTIGGNDLAYIAAHDFFLTRNHHGAGFWDKGNIYGEREALWLTEISHKQKEVGCYHVRGKKSKLTFD